MEALGAAVRAREPTAIETSPQDGEKRREGFLMEHSFAGSGGEGNGPHEPSPHDIMLL
jgi:hypothetical protein